MSTIKIKTLTEFLRKFPVTNRITIKWGDMDAFKHVNNTGNFLSIFLLMYFTIFLSSIF
jgi:hypothetical protein